MVHQEYTDIVIEITLRDHASLETCGFYKE